MSRAVSLLHLTLGVCFGLAPLGLAQKAIAERPETFHADGGVMGLLYTIGPGIHRLPAVLIVHDTLGMDQRSHRYVSQLTAAGLLVLEVELRANPPDGMAEPLPGEDAAAELVAAAAQALARDARVDPRRIGALGFGIGARAVALVPQADGREPFAARLLLYPGCASLDAFLRGPQRASNIVQSPALVLHGMDDPANSVADCQRLAASLGTPERARSVAYAAATYAWDLPQTGGSATAVQPWPRRAEMTVPVRSWPELAEFTAAKAAGFLGQALTREGLEGIEAEHQGSRTNRHLAGETGAER